jgi:ribosomal-protein-alanine N-acetyltransferase
MEIRDMTEETAGAVAALEEKSFSTPWSEASIRGELGQPYSIWLTAMEGSALLGYLGVQYGPDGGDIMTIATQEAARGRGIATALLEAMFQRLREQDLHYLTLEVRPSNLPALRLYEALGFTQVGRRPRYYQNPREDALLLTKYFEVKENATFGN